MLTRSVPLRRGARSPPVISGWPQTDYEASVMITNKFVASAISNRRDKDYSTTRKSRLQFYADFRKLRKSGVAGVLAYSAGMKFFGKLGMPARAQALFDTSLEDHISPTAGMFVRLMQAYAHVSDFEGMAYVISISGELTSSPGVAARYIHYLAIALHKGGFNFEALDLLAATWPIHLGSKVIYTTMLQCCSSFNDSLQIMNDIEAENREIRMTEWGSFIDSAGSQGDVRSCLHIMETMRRQHKVSPSLIHLTTLITACVTVYDEKLFKKMYQIIVDKGIEFDRVGRRLLLRFAELTATAVDTTLDNTGGVRLVEIRVGIRAALGDFASAESEYHKRVLVLGTAKTWSVLECRLLSAALHDWMKLKGMTGSALRHVLCNYSWLINEKNGLNEGIWIAAITASKLNQGYGSLILYRMIKDKLLDYEALKMPRLSLPALKRLSDCLAARVRHLMAQRDGWPPQEAVLSAKEHFKALMTIYEAIFNKGPYCAAALLSPLIIAHSSLGLAEQMIQIYRTLLLASHHSHMLEHADAFIEIFNIRGDNVAVGRIQNLHEEEKELISLAQVVI
eukprot:TRINITY_DN11752_c0_g1_i1.p1 TRINITY_DN11752_c0_g1~~TRINITY_DN11752_c0_g1_i1.p1  ORF type:complete len:566 (+),score=85.05 TRINITY_DN11752_c0_g1_i1:71-1768(+)